MHNAYSVIIITLIFWRLGYSQDFSWHQTNGPEGGYSYSIDSHNDTLFVGGLSGLYFSPDSGSTWELSGLSSMKVIKMAFYDNKWFAATYRDRIFLSTDNGTSWEQLTEGFPYWFNIKDMVIIDTTLIVASEYDGVYRSQDWGVTWVEANDGIDNIQMEKLQVGDTTVIVSAAGTSGSGMFYSTNSGESWIRVDPYPYAWNAEDMCVFQDTLYGVDFNNNAKVYLSTDDGVTWTLPEGATNPADIMLSITKSEFGLFAGMMRDGLFKSTDIGITWQDIGESFENKTITELSEMNGMVFASSYQGILKSSDGGANWESINGGRVASWITSINSLDDYLFASTYGGGMFRSLDRGETWEPINNGINHIFIWDFVIFQNILLASARSSYQYGGVLFKSTDYGDSWEELDFNYGAPYCLTTNDNYIFAGTRYDGIYRSSNEGMTWQSVENEDGYNTIKTMACIGDTVLYGSAGSPAHYYLSYDSGDSWTEIDGPDILHISTIESLGDKFYAGSDGASTVYYSEDYGQSWQVENSPLGNGEVSSFEVIGDTIYVGVNSGGYGFYETTGHGLLVSTDGGDTWSRELDSTLCMNVHALHYFNGELFVGTYGGGVLRYSKLDDSLRVDIGNNRYVTGQFSLYGNYPNPFNNRTTIRYGVFSPSRLRLEILNIRGQVVETLLNDYQHEGIYFLDWNAKSISSGVYFISLRSNRRSITRKILLIR